MPRSPSLRVAVFSILVASASFALAPAHAERDWNAKEKSRQDVGATPAARASAPTPASDPIAAGFRLLYELKFEQARATFQAHEKAAPQDPLGPAAEAASYLFDEFYRQGVLTSQFFLDDKKFLNGIEGAPDPKLKHAFWSANGRAQDLARQLLKANPDDPSALYALTITTGMRGNYLGVIEKRHLESLRLTKEAGGYAKKLLERKPGEGDVYVALGISNYIVGSLPVYKKFFLFFGGIRGEKQEGMRQLALAARDGHYLRPFAKILLALAALREKEPGLARTHLEELVAEFPQNPLFARELALLKHAPGTAATGP
ncbi:MAG TPA: hypothetical protein VGQ11_05090 [Candidatus Acidoferrales bacterium]|nr:hypothetical protein [Candidatus Acidoferrales bacterium]